jgi:hypothetical protein|tara:strand:- start:464 stop:625 length:162 start_codon:yes stop_codon:yes gene_type:complete
MLLYQSIFSSLVAVAVVHHVMVVVAVLALLSIRQVMEHQLQHIRSPSVVVVMD